MTSKCQGSAPRLGTPTSLHMTSLTPPTFTDIGMANYGSAMGVWLLQQLDATSLYSGPGV